MTSERTRAELVLCTALATVGNSPSNHLPEEDLDGRGASLRADTPFGRTLDAQPHERVSSLESGPASDQLSVERDSRGGRLAGENGELVGMFVEVMRPGVAWSGLGYVALSD